jgi:hypothetical protein
VERSILACVSDTDRPDKTISPHTLDAGVNLGVTPAAPDAQAFFGMTVRF